MNGPYLYTLLLVPLAMIPLLIIGLLLLVKGRQGKPIDDHPLCRRCGFDLIGIPRESDRCSECGADIRAPGAIRIGHRRRRPILSLTGGLIVGLFAAALVTTGINVARQVDWVALKPHWWLMHDARDGSTSSGRRAIHALIIRATSPDADREDRAALIALLIRQHSDPAMPWNPTWGDFLSDCVLDGSMTDLQRDQFLDAMLKPVVLRIRKDIRMGDPLPMNIEVGGPRMPAQTTLAGYHFTRDEQFMVDGRPLPPPPNDPGTGGGGSTLSGVHSINTSLQPDRLRDIAVGTHQIRVSTVIEIRSGLGRDAPVLRRVPITANATFHLHPPDATLITAVQDPALAGALSQMRASITPSGNYWYVTLRQSDRMPLPGVDFAFNVIFRQSGREWLGGTILGKAGRHHSWSFSTSAEQLRPGKVDIVLRSNPDAARSSLDIYAVWDGELLLGDISVPTEP